MSDRRPALATSRPTGNVCPLCYNTGTLASGATCVCREMPATFRPDDDDVLPPAPRSATPTVRFRGTTRSVDEVAEELHEQADADATARDNARHLDRNR